MWTLEMRNSFRNAGEEGAEMQNTLPALELVVL